MYQVVNDAKSEPFLTRRVSSTTISGRSSRSTLGHYRCSLDGAAVSGQARLEESRDEQIDHAAGIGARVVVGANAEAADATHQFLGITIGAAIPGFRGGV